MKQELDILDAVIEEVCKTVTTVASNALASASTKIGVKKDGSNAKKPVTIDGSRRKFVQQILYSTSPDETRRQTKTAVKKEVPVLQSTPSLASNNHDHEEEETVEANDNKEPVEDKEESRDTVSSPHQNVVFGLTADREKEEKPSSCLSMDGVSDHHHMTIEKRLSTSMCNEKEMREGLYQHIGKAPFFTNKNNGAGEMTLQKVQRQASKDDCCGEAALDSSHSAGPTMTKKNKDGNPLDQLFHFVEKSVCGKIPTQARSPKEELSLEGNDPFDCECVVSDVQRSTTRKEATRVILQVRKVLKSARGKNEEAPAFSSLPIRVLERENSVITELIADQYEEEQEKEDKADQADTKEKGQADTDQDKETVGGTREEPEPKPLQYESAKDLLSSRCRERLDDYRREKGHSAYGEEPMKEVPMYSTKMTKKEIIDREKLRAQYQ